MHQNSQPPSPPGAPVIQFNDDQLFDDDYYGSDDDLNPGLGLQPFGPGSLTPNISVTAPQPPSRPSSAHSGDRSARRTTWPSEQADEVAEITYFPIPISEPSRQAEEEGTLDEVHPKRFLAKFGRAQTLGGPIASSQTTAEEAYKPSEIDDIESSTNLPRFPVVCPTHRYDGETQEMFNSRANLAAVQNRRLGELMLAIMLNHRAIESFANQPDLQLTEAQYFEWTSANSVIEVEGLPKDDDTREWVEYWETQKTDLGGYVYGIDQ